MINKMPVFIGKKYICIYKLADAFALQTSLKVFITSVSIIPRVHPQRGSNSTKKKKVSF